MRYSNYWLQHGALLVLLAIAMLSCSSPTPVALFDGKTLSGWEGSTEVFRVENGAIIGGSLDTPLAESYYLCTEEEYADFELSLQVKFIDPDTVSNAGISFRAQRVPGTNEVGGYQADLGYTEPRHIPYYSDHQPKDTIRPYPLWGMLVDECRDDVSRYPRPHWFPVVFLQIPDRSMMDTLVKTHDWNQVRIIADGPHIEIQINGVTTVQYTEDMDVPGKGRIALQAHSGAPYEVHYKDIGIRIGSR